MVNPYSIAGTLVVLVALAGAWRAWVMQARESGFMDRALRRLGHRPPEDDEPGRALLDDEFVGSGEDTMCIPGLFEVVYGRHSKCREKVRHGAYEGRHHREAWSWLVAGPGNEAPQ
jgi:hypothetical protein